MMNKILIYLIVLCSFSPLTAQTQADKENLKNYIRMYVSTLDEKVQEIERLNDMDSVKASALEINTEMRTIFSKIAKVYRVNEKARKAGSYFGIAYAMDDIVEGSGTYYRLKAIKKLLRKTDNSRYFKKMAKLNDVAKEIWKTKKQPKLDKLKIELRDILTDLNAMELK